MSKNPPFLGVDEKWCLSYNVKNVKFKNALNLDKDTNNDYRSR